jgi:hypothetical protein
MLKTIFYALTYWAPALLICLAVAARAAAPFPYGGADYTQSVAASLISVARELSDKGDRYVRVDGHDPSADILTELNSRKLPSTFVPWSGRSPKQDHCRAAAPDTVVAGACMQDNFLSADLLSMPLWHVALVRVTTAACTAELTVVRGPTQWHVLSQRAVCI